jgi:CRISPR system Cascade subunit CasC
MSLQDFGIKLAIRTKKIAEHIATKCLTLGATDEQAKACGEKIASAFSKDTLHFLTESESTAFANYAHEKSFDKEQLNEKELQKLSKKTLNPSVDGLDIALFGIMVTQAADLQIEAASSFAHAISTHKVNNEVEFLQP